MTRTVTESVQAGQRSAAAPWKYYLRRPARSDRITVRTDSARKTAPASVCSVSSENGVRRETGRAPCSIAVFFGPETAARAIAVKFMPKYVPEAR